MKHRSSILSLCTFVAVIILVEIIWGWSTLLSFWQALPVSLLILFTFLYWFSYLVRSLRISIYFNSDKIWLPTRIVLPIVVKQTFWANLLPAKAGEISFPILMKRAFDTPYTHSVPALLVLRLFDAYVLASIALGLVLAQWSAAVLTIWLLIALLIPLLGVNLRKQSIGLVYRFRATKKARFFWRILSSIPDQYSTLIKMTALSWLNWAVKIFLFAALLSSMTPFELPQTILGALFGEVSGMLPGLPGGFGSYEAAVSFGLLTHATEQIAVDKSLIVAAALNSHFFILFNSVAGAIIAFLLPNKLTTPEASDDK
jgi:uncharacterized membrane protein YbhN (UPF0104 family)